MVLNAQGWGFGVWGSGSRGWGWGSGSRAWGLGFREQVLGSGLKPVFGILGFRSRVSGSRFSGFGFRVSGSRFSGFGFRVSGFGLREQGEEIGE
jgi:hypothetical protein